MALLATSPGENDGEHMASNLSGTPTSTNSSSPSPSPGLQNHSKVRRSARGSRETFTGQSGVLLVVLVSITVVEGEWLGVEHSKANSCFSNLPCASAAVPNVSVLDHTLCFLNIAGEVGRGEEAAQITIR